MKFIGVPFAIFRINNKKPSSYDPAGRDIDQPVPL